MSLPTTPSERLAFDTLHAVWLIPVRQAFQAHMQAHEGYRPLATPKPGVTYPGSHAQMMWECWLAATLHANATQPDGASFQPLGELAPPQ